MVQVLQPFDAEEIQLFLLLLRFCDMIQWSAFRDAFYAGFFLNLHQQSWMVFLWKIYDVKMYKDCCDGQ